MQNNLIWRRDIVRKKHIILGMILIIYSTLFFIGCSGKENKELSYEIISFENAPKEVQERMRWHEERNPKHYSNEGYNASGGFDLGIERYVYFIVNEGSLPIILDVVPDEAYGRGIIIKHTSENKDNAKFPDTSVIVKLNEYYGEIANVFISHP